MTELKDVIHFYLGCKFEYIDPLTRDRVRGTVDGKAIDRWHYYEKNKGKLFLRPLSSMTEEEAQELRNQFGLTVHFDEWPSIHKWFTSQESYSLEETPEHWMVNPQQSWDVLTWAGIIQWLCKNGYDIFNLIPTNQAKEKK